MNNGAEQDQDKQNLFAVVSSEDSEEPEFEELSGPVKKRRGIYLLPNLLTTGAMFGGFYAILAAMNGKFEAAAVAIFVAMLFDGLDGRVARMTHTESDFGVQYDSLSDMVSFGVAPAVVSFSWMLYTLGKLGWAGAFIYASCAALRLARFNTQVGTADSRFFSGLASPAAAGLVAAMVWTGYDAEPSRSLALMALFVTAIAGLLMVAPLRYSSMKGVDFRGRVPFVAIFAIVMVVSIILIDPPRMLLAMAVMYALSGPLVWCWRRFRKPVEG
ncbi:MAG TPA: CDP-diacylglycerol--serine O-phosphatidyltransferase [Porticoccaceae bacterium]|nr:CDP-diacylglycerol--serine O-phosphatidyltransferase [Porticoccaceae bacterium]HCO60231.1 CDP-diacylglycerol--serine O-phosphatidyltransferase [Porticoccaceae bacterium]